MAYFCPPKSDNQLCNSLKLAKFKALSICQTWLSKQFSHLIPQSSKKYLGGVPSFPSEDLLSTFYPSPVRMATTESEKFPVSFFVEEGEIDSANNPADNAIIGELN